MWLEQQIGGAKTSLNRDFGVKKEVQDDCNKIGDSGLNGTV